MTAGPSLLVSYFLEFHQDTLGVWAALERAVFLMGSAKAATVGIEVEVTNVTEIACPIRVSEH